MSANQDTQALVDTSDQQLSRLLDTDKEVTIGGKKLVVGKMKVKQLRKVMAIIRPVIGSLAAGSYGKTAEEKLDKTNIGQLVVEHTDTVLELIAVFVDIEMKDLEDLRIDQLVSITTQVLEVNLDFFIQNVLPQFLELFQRVTEAVAKSQTKTPGQTESTT